jgi:hypothetical protein
MPQRAVSSSSSEPGLPRGRDLRLAENLSGAAPPAEFGLQVRQEEALNHPREPGNVLVRGPPAFDHELAIDGARLHRVDVVGDVAGISRGSGSRARRCW